MISDHPYFQKMFKEQHCAASREAALEILKQRFGAVPDAVSARLRLIEDQARLEALAVEAAVRGLLVAFEEALP